MLPILREKDKLPKIIRMNKEYFSLGPYENSITLKIIRIMFGLVCIAIALFWLIFSFRLARADHMIWITVLFLAGFGMYQIWAGSGRAKRFIEIGNEKIVLRQNSFLPRREMAAAEIKKIEVYPLNLIFYLRKGGRTVLRFGTSFADIIDPVKETVERFAEQHNISLETIREEI
jgi:hypothetical protein